MEKLPLEVLGVIVNYCSVDANLYSILNFRHISRKFKNAIEWAGHRTTQLIALSAPTETRGAEFKLIVDGIYKRKWEIRFTSIELDQYPMNGLDYWVTSSLCSIHLLVGDEKAILYMLDYLTNLLQKDLKKGENFQYLRISSQLCPDNSLFRSIVDKINSISLEFSAKLKIDPAETSYNGVDKVSLGKKIKYVDFHVKKGRYMPIEWIDFDSSQAIEEVGIYQNAPIMLYYLDIRLLSSIFHKLPSLRKVSLTSIHVVGNGSKMDRFLPPWVKELVVDYTKFTIRNRISRIPCEINRLDFIYGVDPEAFFDMFDFSNLVELDAEIGSQQSSLALEKVLNTVEHLGINIFGGRSFSLFASNSFRKSHIKALELRNMYGPLSSQQVEAIKMLPYLEVLSFVFGKEIGYSVSENSVKEIIRDCKNLKSLHFHLRNEVTSFDIDRNVIEYYRQCLLETEQVSL